jgi:hypothetical protein
MSRGKRSGVYRNAQLESDASYHTGEMPGKVCAVRCFVLYEEKNCSGVAEWQRCHVIMYGECRERGASERSGCDAAQPQHERTNYLGRYDLRLSLICACGVIRGVRIVLNKST